MSQRSPSPCQFEPIFTHSFMVLRNYKLGKLAGMDPTYRRTLAPISAKLTEVGSASTSSKSSASFQGAPEAIRNRLNRAHEMAQSLNRQLGNLLHFIQQSSYLAIEADGDRPQEILWVASKKAGLSDSEELDEMRKLRLEKGLAELPAQLRAQVERFIEDPTSKASGKSSKAVEVRDSITPNNGWSYEVLLLRPDHEVVPEATIAYPALGLNEDGDVCFLADVYPEKLKVTPNVSPLVKESSGAQTMSDEVHRSTASSQKAATIDVVQLFWDALTRAGTAAKIPLHAKKD